MCSSMVWYHVVAKLLIKITINAHVFEINYLILLYSVEPMAQVCYNLYTNKHTISNEKPTLDFKKSYGQHSC